MTTNATNSVVAANHFLARLIDSTTKKVMWEIANIKLQYSGSHNIPKNNLYTCYTTIQGAYQTRLAFCADRSLMSQIAEKMLDEPVTDREELIECMKEFTNILCGHIISTIFNKTNAAARFHPPHFQEGPYPPSKKKDDSLVTFCYTSAQSEIALVHYDNFYQSFQGDSSLLCKHDISEAG